MLPLPPRRTSLALALACVMLLPLLNACAAVVAIPLVAGGVLKARDRVRVRAATRAASAPAAITKPVVTITALSELPPPDSPSPADRRSADAWQPFIEYALARAAAKDAPRLAAVLATSSLAAPDRARCQAPTPAVVVDLDEGKGVFAPKTARAAPTGLAADLAKLRAAGIVVLWISQLPAAQVGDVTQALAASGLDPEGRDQLLLIRSADDRKQVLRIQANADVCIVAIAGDRRADFDELFDFLRNPDSAIALSPMLGAGWFLVPAPFGNTDPEP